MFRRQKRFRPPSERRRRLVEAGWLPPVDWRKWALSAISRAIIAIAFGAIPALEARFGDLSLTVICCVSAAFVGAVVGWIWHANRDPIRRELLADILALLALVPIVEVSATIQIADSRFGGRLPNALAGLGAAVAVFMILILVSRPLPPLFPSDPAVAVLPGALIIAAGIGGATYFTTERFWQGMSAAWLAAATATLIYGLGPQRLRGVLAVVVFALFSFAVIFLAAAGEDGPNVSPDASRVAFVGLVVVALLLLATALPSNKSAPRRGDPPGSTPHQSLN